MKNILIFLFAGFVQLIQAQNFIPGQSYFNANGYIEYIAGNLPLVISVPHGGSLAPAEIPDRSCADCVVLADSKTQELGRELSDSIFKLTGRYPHVIINRLHRKKLDANREIVEAAQGNPIAEQSWHDFHQFIDTAKQQVLMSCNKGLYLDLHGHAHTKARIELGYLLTKTNLQQSDSILNTLTYINKSGIRNLVGNNLLNWTHAQLLRDSFSLGNLLFYQGYPAVPSAADPFPLPDDPYFDGGYNTNRHGSRTSGTIDGIQMECNADIRLTNAARRPFAGKLAVVLVDYLRLFYFPHILDNQEAPCQQASAVSDVHQENAMRIFPSPSCGRFTLEMDTPFLKTRIYNVSGMLVWEGPSIENRVLQIDLNLKPGIYWISCCTKNGIISTRSLSVNCD